MNPLLYQLTVYAHVLACIFLTGYALFWTILALAERAEGEREDPLRDVMGRAAWPPAPIPSALRLRLTEIGWGSLFVMVATGFFAYAAKDWLDRGSTEFQLRSSFGIKLLLVGLLFAILAAAGRSPRRLWLHLFLFVNLAIISLSAIIAR